MARIGFVGPTYQSQSPTADAERCVNWYYEVNEAPQGKSKASLYPSPGLKTFCDLSQVEQNALALFAQNGRCFAVVGTHFYEIFSSGQSNQIGTVAYNAKPATIVGSQTQLLILAAGFLYTYNLSNGNFAPVNMTQFNSLAVSMIGYSDGFFLALVANSQTLQVSNLLDATTWQGLNIGQVSVFPDNLVGMLVDHREVWLWGSKASTVYYDTGAAFFPFSPIPGVYLETGAASVYGQVKLNNSVFWVHLDDRGTAMAFKANGYTPERVSNSAIEYIWSTYPTVADVRVYSYVDQGHPFWHLYFPSANASWRYDDSTGVWHEPLSWDGAKFVAHRSQCHTFAYGRHLVGDPLQGIIYDMSIKYGTDNGNPIHRLRIGPTVSQENKYLLHRRVQLDCETGIATAPLFGPSPTNRGNGIGQWVISDQTGTSWTIQIDASGDFIFSETPGVFAQNVYLQDTVLPTVWQLGIDSTDPTNPYITVTAVVGVPQVLILSVQPFVTLRGFQSQVFVESGVLTKLIPNQQRGPIVSMRWSDDNAHTWSSWHVRDCGQPGEYLTRVIWRRLGRSRNRTYAVSYADPFPLRIIELDLDAEPGFQATERLTNLINKGA